MSAQKQILARKRILITGGTGSLGKMLTQSILTGQYGIPESITIFSRDEDKQHQMRLSYLQKTVSTDEVIYNNFSRCLRFVIGDIRSYTSLSSALRNTDIVIHAAALKQVPAIQYFPWQGIQTNLHGVHNLTQIISDHNLPVETVLGISTDKAVQPINAYGRTKALQEDVIVAANLFSKTRWICVRYGNVLASRGSVIPLFQEQIKNGGPVTLTTKEMTRFWLPLSQCVQIIMDTLAEAAPGEIYVPQVRSSRILDLALLLIGDRPIKITETGIRPGEKVHEILISPEEAAHTIRRGNYYVILPTLPELSNPSSEPLCTESYCSANNPMPLSELAEFLTRVGVL